MALNVLIGTFWRRFALASAVWLVTWPIVMFFTRGDITGPQAWFWIIGQLNYPVAALVYVLLDAFIRNFIEKPAVVFVVAVVLMAACMPTYYERYGFALGVSVEARFF